MRGELLFAGEDVEKHTVEFVRTARGVVFDDDVLQFAQLGLDLVVLTAEDIDRIGGVFLPREQRLDVGEDGLLLVGHVALDLSDILVEKAHDRERHIAQRAIDRLDQLASDRRQAEIEEITV